MQYTVYATQGFMGFWTGEFPDLPGCAPEGEDMEDFLNAIQPAVEEWAAANGISALPEPSNAEPDFSDPKRRPMLVEVDESFLSADTPAQCEQGEQDAQA